MMTTIHQVDHDGSIDGVGEVWSGANDKNDALSDHGRGTD